MPCFDISSRLRLPAKRRRPLQTRQRWISIFVFLSITVKGASVRTLIGRVLESYFFSVTFTLAVVFAQSSFKVAVFPLVLSREIVNCSVGEAFLETFMSTRARSWLSAYLVPHCPVSLLMISFQPVSLGIE